MDTKHISFSTTNIRRGIMRQSHMKSAYLSDFPVCVSEFLCFYFNHYNLKKREILCRRLLRNRRTNYGCTKGKRGTVYAFEQDKEAVQHSFSEDIKVGIYEDLYVNFSQMDLVEAI